MPKYDRNQSYAEIHTDLDGEVTITSPRETAPKKFALVCFDEEDEGANAFITTHATLGQIVDHIEADESDFQPSYVVDLDTGKQWEPVFSVSLEEGGDDYFAEEAADAAAD